MAYRMTNHPHNASIVIRSRRYLICFSTIHEGIAFAEFHQESLNVVQNRRFQLRLGEVGVLAHPEKLGDDGIFGL